MANYLYLQLPTLNTVEVETHESTHPPRNGDVPDPYKGSFALFWSANVTGVLSVIDQLVVLPGNDSAPIKIRTVR